MQDGLLGTLVVATPSLVDPNFARTVVFILQHDDDGSLGVVLNRPTIEPVVDHLPHWADHVADPASVFIGGPVEPEIAVGVRAVPGGGVELIDLSDEPGPDDIVRVFSGYSGWGPGQLEAEIAEGSWWVVEGGVNDVFEPDPTALWSQVLRRQPGEMRFLATLPMDPSLN